jgi:hypothetical protein
MTKYFFDLLHDGVTILDSEGVLLSDDRAAEEYAAKIARELIRHKETKKRHWSVSVRNANETIFELPLYKVDDTLAALSPHVRRIIERTSRLRMEHLHALAELRATRLRVKATIARSRKKPYLIAEGGGNLGRTPREGPYLIAENGKLL